MKNVSRSQSLTHLSWIVYVTPSGVRQFLKSDESNPNIDGLALMLSGNYYLIEDLIGDYQDSTIIGISGGAWYATILAALLPQIAWDAWETIGKHAFIR